MSESSPAGEPNSDTDTSDKEVTECPTCGRTDFKSNRGMRMHHAKMHNESLSKVEFECDYCSEKFTRPLAWIRKDSGIGGYCSEECRDIDKDMGIRNRETRNCDACGGEFEVVPSSEQRFCTLECAYGNRSKDIAHTKDCPICGDEFRTGGESKSDKRKTCGKECGAIYKSIHYTGEDSPTWKGGYENYYGPNWSEKRQEARERDNHACQYCGVSESELDRELSVHHIQPIREYRQQYDAPEWYEKGNNLENLVTLCEPCHGKWEGLYLRPDTR